MPSPGNGDVEGPDTLPLPPRGHFVEALKEVPLGNVRRDPRGGLGASEG